MDVEAVAAEMDAWCRKRIAQMTPEQERHVMSGGSLDDPRYRTLLGRHQAYMAMRSYIHGSRRQHLIEKGEG